MSLYDSLRKNLTSELFTQVTDQLGDDFDFDLVPRSRLNKVIKQRNDLREQLSGNSQPRGDGDPDTVDTETPTPTPTDKEPQERVDIEAMKKQWLAEQGDAVREVKIQYAALEKLREAKAIDPEVIWNAGLIDKSKITIGEGGQVVGLDTLVESLVKSKSKLFGTANSGVNHGTGKNGGADSFAQVSTRDDFLKLTVDQQLAFKQANPEIFKTFLERR